MTHDKPGLEILEARLTPDEQIARMFTTFNSISAAKRRRANLKRLGLNLAAQALVIGSVVALFYLVSQAL